MCSRQDQRQDQRQRHRTGVSDPHGLVSSSGWRGAGSLLLLKGWTGLARARRCASWRACCARLGTRLSKRASRGERLRGRRFGGCCWIPSTEGLAPLAEMALMFASRAQHIAEVILPALGAWADRAVRSLHRFHGSLSRWRAEAGLRGGDGATSGALRRVAAGFDDSAGVGSRR